MQNILLTVDPIETAAIENYVRCHSEGAQVFFSGTPRTQRHGETVTGLYFEAYEPMAIEELDRIKDKATQAFQLQVVIIHHRLGTCLPMQHAVFVGVGAPHRKQAFEACMWIMDELKQRVPIWKKETLASGAFWVTPHP